MLHIIISMTNILITVRAAYISSPIVELKVKN